MVRSRTKDWWKYRKHNAAQQSKTNHIKSVPLDFGAGCSGTISDDAGDDLPVSFGMGFDADSYRVFLDADQ